jgi:hypothetical protein
MLPLDGEIGFSLLQSGVSSHSSRYPVPLASPFSLFHGLDNKAHPLQKILLCLEAWFSFKIVLRALGAMVIHLGKKTSLFCSVIDPPSSICQIVTRRWLGSSLHALRKVQKYVHLIHWHQYFLYGTQKRTVHRPASSDTLLS